MKPILPPAHWSIVFVGIPVGAILDVLYPTRAGFGLGDWIFVGLTFGVSTYIWLMFLQWAKHRWNARSSASNK